MTAERIHLIVLFGGESAEHDVSCTTAAHVLAAVDPARYRVTPIGISTDGHWALATEPARALPAGPSTLPVSEDADTDTDTMAIGLPRRLEVTGSGISPAALFDDAARAGERTVVLPLLHGPLGEDGTVQGLLELAGLPYVGSGVLGSALAMDKAMAKRVLADAGIAQTRSVAFAEHAQTPGLAADLVDRLGLPCFVKPSNMGSSVGVSKAHTTEELRDAIEHALTYDEWVVVEEAVDGREIEVAVLGGTAPEASLPGEIVPGDEFYSYADKYETDGAQLLVPAPLSSAESDEVRALALQAFAALRCDGLARVDFFYEADGRGRGFLCNEVNTMPGFTPISMFPKLWLQSGMTYSGLIDRLVDLALARHARRRRNTKH